MKNDSTPLEPTSHALQPNNEQPTTQRSSRRFVITFLIVLLFCLGISIGFFASLSLQSSSENLSYEDAVALLKGEKKSNTSQTTPPAGLNMDQFWKVWNTIQTTYVNQPIDTDELIYGAIRGLVSGLDDPYSLYFDPEASKKFMGEIEGEFEGIGAEIGIKNNQLTVVAPLPDSPAEKAGLRPGDHILAIDNLDAVLLSLNTAVQHIRGPKDSQVTLKISRTGVEQPFDVVITRAEIHVKSVQWSMETIGEKKLAVVTISQFNTDTTPLFQEASQQIVLEKPDGIVLDLRNNPGGYLTAAIELASQFVLEGNVVVYEQGSDGVKKALNASGQSPLRDIPVVVLINEGSASASEILAGALKDYKKATIIGVTSFGKGTVQNFETFDDGSALKLTIAKWFTPLSHQIDKRGIDPDYLVELTAEDDNHDEDPQLDAARLFLTDRGAFDQQHTPYVPPAEDTDE